ncbi:hypothetical protein [Caenimonas sp. SL110]|uniref:hypothetical protein n=1 Tax=Caenimonas sp. SL110 TaxID=1450524 RepID=UPI00128AE833|nr:hypothetical protein [Caenimonas sp. SL110]
MDPTDLNFTYSIVGPPMSVVLGTRMQPRDYASTGLSIDMRDSRRIPGRNWMEWVLLRNEGEWVGRVRKRPSAARLWLERHGLVLAVTALGLLALEVAAALAWTFFYL